jgi:trehalose 6-phosphate phosphatase
VIDLFSVEGRAALERLARQKTLYAFDFDGTLAPIVPRPDDARAQPSTVALLKTLGARVPTLLLTGRGIDDLRQRIAFAPTFLVGNHGAEGLPDAISDEDGHAAHRVVVQRWLAQWPAVIARQIDDPDIVVETKAYSLSIHYRASRDHDAAIRAISAAIKALDPSPHVIGGKCVFNLLPEGAPDKGHALSALVEYTRCTAAFFIGDDVTDETGFADAPASWVTVRVGHSSASKARYFIDDQSDIDRCLEQLVASVEAVATSRLQTAS